MVMAAAMLVLAQAGAALEVRVGEAWQPLPLAAAGAPVRRLPLLEDAVSWTDVEPGVRVGDFTVRTAGGRLRNSIAVIELDSAAWSFTLGLTRPRARRTAETWLDADSTIDLVVNTGLFSGDGTPIGLVLLDGVRRRSRARWIDAVVVMEDGALRFTDVAGSATLAPGASAFQTTPWLIRDGRVAFGAISGRSLSADHRDRRLALCLAAGSVRVVLSNFEVFGATAGTIPIGLTIPEQVAIVAGLGCREAVALDGGISAQLALRLDRRLVSMPGWRRVPLMILGRRRR